MNSSTRSIILFLFACIPTRAFILTAIGRQWVPAWASILYLCSVGVAFLTLFITNARMHAPEAGGTTWWASHRLVIGLLYLLAGGSVALRQDRLAASFLAVDLFAGMHLFLNHRKIIYTMGET